jgi:gliding motility-associated-like protein
MVVVRDGNSCKSPAIPVYVDFVNTVELTTIANPVICESSNTPLNATTNAQSVVWSPAASLSSAAVLNPVASPVVTTTYYITATTGVCYKKDSVTVIVNPAPRPDAGPDISICFGGTTALQGSGAMEYEWSPSTYLSNTTDASPTVTRPAASLTYFLRVKDFNGCHSLLKDTVKVMVIPAVRMFAGNDTLIAIGQPLQLNGIQLGSNTVVNYSWSPSNGLSNTGAANPLAVVDKDMVYTLTGKTALNCEGSDVIKVKVYEGPEIYVPSVFSPNNDGLNDMLRAWAIGMKEYRYFKIFNRWGQMIFSTSDFNKGWDGKIKGIAQNTGSFVWFAEAVDFRGKVISRKGTITLLR